MLFTDSVSSRETGSWWCCPNMPADDRRLLRNAPVGGVVVLPQSRRRREDIIPGSGNRGQVLVTLREFGGLAKSQEQRAPHRGFRRVARAVSGASIRSF